MDLDQTDYRKLVIEQFPSRDLRETPEGRYWKRFSSPLTAKQIGAVTHVEFCLEYPHNIAVTSGTRIIIYDGSTGGLLRKFTRFKDKAYGGTLRSDGKLLAAGGESSVVQLFDSNSRALLRQLSGHTRPVHKVNFANDRLHLISAGDDAVARWWDLTTGQQVTKLVGHADYIRSCASNPSNHEVWATGSYDHVCKLWDIRSGQNTLQVDHGAPIESITFLPSGSIFVTAGGPYICLWDVFSGGRLLKRLNAHQKTVTSVITHNVPSSNGSVLEGPRLLSASLDGHMKVYNLSNFQITHSSKYPAPILAMGLAPDSKMLAVGMADGTLSMRSNSRSNQTIERQGIRRYQPRLTASSFRYFKRGQTVQSSSEAYVIAARQKTTMQPYDKMLRQFHYREALSLAMAVNRPEVFISMIDELTNRGGLGAALSGRSEAEIIPIVDVMARYAADPRYTQRMVSLAHQLLDMYGGSIEVGQSSVQKTNLYGKLTQLQEQVRIELRLQDELVGIKGMLDAICSS